MLICVVKETNRILEMQSDARAGTLIQNAINYGYKETEVEEKEVTALEYSATLKIDPVEVAIQAAKEAEATGKEEEKLGAYKDIDTVKDIEELKTFIKKYILIKVY